MGRLAINLANFNSNDNAIKLCSQDNNISLYIHWPFCKSKCPYCDFNSHVANKIDRKKWLGAYTKQLDAFSELLCHYNIKTIYFGGGTPTLAPNGVIEGIVEHLSNAEYANISRDIEITMEANPTSIELEKFRSLRESGINRVSVGIQSLRKKYLEFLGRNHSESESLKALETARKYFDNTSFDLIYCLPNQTLKEWMEDLEYASKILDKHISLYQLTIEKGTKFYQQYHKENAFKMPSGETSEKFYDETLNFLDAIGIRRYEISNYARSGFESKHNLVYWNYGKYLGVGPGAHSRMKIGDKYIGQVMYHSPNKWLSEVLNGGNGVQSKSEIGELQIFEERLMMGFRTIYGVPSDFFDSCCGNIKGKLNELINSGYLIDDSNKVVPTNRGFKVLNEILRQLLAQI